MNNIKTIPRRVVTGYRDGTSTILEDDTVKNVVTHDAGFVISDVWATNSIPTQPGDSAKVFGELFPKTHQNGSLFRYVKIPPDSSTLKYFEVDKEKPHPLMHQTDTLDYIIILSGEVYLVMEDCETLLQSGDIVIQKGTNHAWSNRTEEPCIQLAILLDAERAA